MAKKTSLDPSRKKKLPAYRSFRLSRTIKPDAIHVIPPLKQLWTDTWNFLWLHRSKMLKFVAVYTLTYLVLVKGLTGFSLDTAELKTELQEAFGGSFGSITTFTLLYASLLSSLSGSSSEITNYFMVTITVVFSLAFIWLVRKLHLKNSTATVKDAFYQGMRPLIPFLVVIGIMLMQLIPVVIGGLIYLSIQSTVLAVSDLELIGITVLAILGLVLTVYLLAGSVFAIYIVTLPNTTPMVALRSSMRLLRIHRWVVLRRMLLFFVALIVLGFVLVLPFIIWFPALAEYAFFIMGCASFAVMHTFMYKLYRSML